MIDKNIINIINIIIIIIIIIIITLLYIFNDKLPYKIYNNSSMKNKIVLINFILNYL